MEATYTVKAALNKHLRLPLRQKEKVIAYVSDLSAYISQLQRRASLFALYHFTRLLEGGEQELDEARWSDDTFWRQLLLLDGATARHSSERVAESWRRFAPHAPPIHGRCPRGAGQAITYAAQRLRTAFFNTIVVPLSCRIYRLVKAYLRTRQDGNAGIPPRTLLLRIEDGKPLAAGLPADVVAFVAMVRTKLGLPQGACLNEWWAKRHRAAVLGFNFWMQGWFVEHDQRGLKLFPVFDVKRSFVQLDAKVVMAALIHGGAMTAEQEEALSGDMQLRQEVVASFFSVPRPGRNVWTLSAHSDGTAIHFHCVTVADWPRFKEQQLAKTTAKMKGKADKKAGVTRDEEAKPKRADAPSARAARKAARKKALSDAAVCELLDKLAVAPEGVAVLGIDPGRVNIATLVLRTERGETKVWGLTARQYYRAAGITKGTARKLRWHGLERIRSWSGLGQAGSLKSGGTGALLAYVAAYNPMAGAWWQEVLKKRHARLRLHGEIGKRRVLDEFFYNTAKEARQAAGGKVVVAAYGAATFSASGRGNLTVPTTAAYKACCRQLPTLLQSEFRTSITCADSVAHPQLEDVWRPKRPVRQQDAALPGLCHGRGNQLHRHGVRGLKFCPECGNFLNRDKNAAINIGAGLGRRMQGLAAPAVLDPNQEA